MNVKVFNSEVRKIASESFVEMGMMFGISGQISLLNGMDMDEAAKLGVDYLRDWLRQWSNEDGVNLFDALHEW